MKNKLKAFTLFELVVSLTVSAIMIAIVYTALNIIQQRFHANKHKLDQNYQDRLLQHVMVDDIDNASWVSASENSITCHIDSLRAIQYRIVDSLLVRVDSITLDTMSRQVWQSNYWYEYQQRNDSGMVDLIHIQMKNERIYAFKKWYAADVLIHF